MRQKVLIGAAIGLWLVTGIGAYQWGYASGERDHAIQLEQVRQAGEDFQRAFQQGMADAQRERDEAAQRAQAEWDSKADERKRRDQQIYDQAYRAETERIAKESQRP